MRITSLNLQGYSDWQKRQPAIVAHLRAMHPDVVIMQEDVYLPDISPLTPSEAINKDLRFPFRHSAITRLQDSPLTAYYREGLTILSRLPIVNTQTLVLKQDPRDEHQRIIQCFDVQTDKGVVQCANIHLSIEDNFPLPVAQLHELFEILSRRGEQRILGGDFNIRDLEAHQALWQADYTATTSMPYVSYPAENKRVDYFLVPNHYRMTNLSISDNDAMSDHRALTIDIQTTSQPAIMELWRSSIKSFF